MIMETLHQRSIKLYCLGLFFLISSIANGQRNIDSLLIVRNALISKVYNATNTPEEKKELIQIGFTIQNAGFVLEENMGDYQGALNYIDQALPVWTALRDYNLQANLLKYKGLLLGYLGNYAEAKSLINHAIRLYDREEETAGMAVSQLNLARVYDHQSKIASAFF